MDNTTPIINRLDIVCTSNEIVGEALSTKFLTLDRQLQLLDTVTIFNNKDTKVANRGEEIPLLVPRGNKFVCLTSVDTKPQDQHYLLYETDLQVLPMILPGLPVPVAQVDIERLWGDTLYGNVLDQNKVYYLCRPGKTTLIQRIAWRVQLGKPVLVGETSIVLFEWRLEL